MTERALSTGEGLNVTKDETLLSAISIAREVVKRLDMEGFLADPTDEQMELAATIL